MSWFKTHKPLKTWPDALLECPTDDLALIEIEYEFQGHQYSGPLCGAYINLNGLLKNSLRGWESEFPDEGFYTLEAKFQHPVGQKALAEYHALKAQIDPVLRLATRKARAKLFAAQQTAKDAAEQKQREDATAHQRWLEKHKKEDEQHRIVYEQKQEKLKQRTHLLTNLTADQLFNLTDPDHPTNFCFQCHRHLPEGYQLLPWNFERFGTGAPMFDTERCYQTAIRRHMPVETKDEQQQIQARQGAREPHT